MIVKQHDMGFFQLMVEMRGSIVPAITPKIIFSSVLGVLVCLIRSFDFFGEQTDEVLSLEFGPFTALGVAISLFLGFHNNASYGRWWEARTYWGQQVIVVRDLSRYLIGIMGVDVGSLGGQHEEKVLVTTPVGNMTPSTTFASSSYSSAETNDIEMNKDARPFLAQTEDQDVFWEGSIRRVKKNTVNNPSDDTYSSWQAHIVYLAIAQTHAFRSQMRPSCKMDGTVNAVQDRNRFLNPSEVARASRSKNPANTILLMASEILGKAHRRKEIDTYSMIHVQKILDQMCFIQTACERIHNTSLPLAYTLLVHRTTVVYVLLVPFAIAPSQGWWTPLFTAIVAYTFFGLDELAKQIQEPMRDRPMCLALSAICRTVEIDALESLGEETREFLKPQRNCVM